MDKTRGNWVPKQIFLLPVLSGHRYLGCGIGSPFAWHIKVQCGIPSLPESEAVFQMHLEYMKATMQCLFVMFQMMAAPCPGVRVNQIDLGRPRTSKPAHSIGSYPTPGVAAVTQLPRCQATRHWG